MHLQYSYKDLNARSFEFWTELCDPNTGLDQYSDPIFTLSIIKILNGFYVISTNVGYLYDHLL